MGGDFCSSLLYLNIVNCILLLVDDQVRLRHACVSVMSDFMSMSIHNICAPDEFEA